MSYIERIIDNDLFPEDDDHIVKHDAQLYLSLNNKVYVPLAIDGTQLTVDPNLQIRYDATVDVEKIDELENHISGMKGSIVVQADIPDNIPNVELPMAADPDDGDDIGDDADDDADADPDDGDDIGDDADADADADSDTDVPFNISDLLTDDEDGDDNADESDFGRGTVVHIDDTAGVDNKTAGQELDELEYGIAGVASKVIYQTYDPTTITDLIKERHQIVEPVILEKLKHLIQTMVANYIRQSKQTPGERLLREGLPSWIVPVSCVKLSLVDQEAFFNAPAEKVGCNMEFDIPYMLKSYVDRMITDREGEVPGTWFQARRDYGVNMIYLTNGCSIVEPLNMRRYPIAGYDYRINLTKSHRDQIDEKRQEQSKNQERGRLRCGAAFARAVTEPGAIESITITKSTGARTNTKVVAIAVYSMNNFTEKPQLVSVNCTSGQGGFTKALDEIVQTILDRTLTDEVFQKCHNFKPIAQLLKTFNMDIFSIGPKMLSRISTVFNVNHPKLNYRHCKVCQSYLLYGKEETKCKTCNTDTTEAEWSDVHNQKMRKDAQEIHTNMHPKRAAIDYGRLHYQDRLFKYIKDHPYEHRPISPPYPDQIDGIKLVSPRAIQLVDGLFYYKLNDKFYTAEDYNILIGEQHQSVYRSHIQNFPNYESIEQQRSLLELAYGHREAQIERANRKLLSGLVINIVKNVPHSDVVVRYLNRILEMDDNDAIYLSMIDQFEELGVIAYDERNGRYVVAKNNEMIICICHKTYIEHGHTFNGDEPFIDDGQCRYCHTVLHDIEQIVDPTNLTGRELIAGNLEEVTDDTYIYLETLLNAVLDRMSEELSSQGWIVTSSNREVILELLKLDTSINVDPYGRDIDGTSQTINSNSGNVRSLILDIDAREKQRRIYVKGKKNKGFAAQYGYDLDTKQVYLTDNTLDYKQLISTYLNTSLASDRKAVINLLLPDPGSPLANQLDSILRDMSKSPTSIRGTKEDVLANDYFLFAYYNLPIVNILSRNISIILGYVSSFLETKYGIKEIIGGKPIYVNNNKQEISEMIKAKLDLNMEFIHEIIRNYTSVLDNKYLTTVSMLRVMAQPAKVVSYFSKMRNLFKYHGSNVFNPRFTLYFSSLFHKDYTAELKRLMDNSLLERRKAEASIYNAMQEGKKPMARERQIAMWYDIASPNVISSVPGSGQTDSIEDYQACKESAQQRTYTGYIDQLRIGYEAASEKAKEITSLEETAVAADGSNIDILTTTGYLAQSQKLLDEPKGDAIPTWKEGMIEARDSHELQLDPPEMDRCEFMPDGYQNIIRRGQLIVDHAFHTTLISIHQGRYDVGELVDRSTIDLGLGLDDQGNDVWVKLTNLRAAEQDESAVPLSQYSFGGLFSDEEDSVIDDNNGNIRKNYVSGTLPDKSRISIVDTHNERAHKAKQMRRVVKLQSEHKLIPEFLRGDDDMEVFKPWGGWDNEQRETAAITEDLVVRRIRRVQNIGMSLIKILRWLGRTMSQMEMDVMGSYIRLSHDSNIIGADLEFKTTRDQIDGMGYILKDLYDLKLELANDPSAESYHLANYESHFEEFYQMSYWEYRTYVQNMDSENASEWDDKTYMLDLVYLSIVSDLYKHIRSMGADGQAVNDPLTPINMDQLPNLRLGPNKGFVKVVAQVLNALIKHAGPEILDPDRSDIDWRYEERFMEYASKRKIVTARSVKRQSGLNINTPYVGQPTNVLDFDEEEDDDTEDPMDMVAPDDYEGEGAPRKDNAQEDDDDYDLEDEMIDMENVIQGESEE